MFNEDDLNQLFRYALSLSTREDVAHDLVQSAIERYLKRPSSIGKPLAYIKTIIRNLYIDIERHNKVIPMLSIENDDVTHTEQTNDNFMEDILISQQEVTYLIAGLNAEENELLYLWAVEEYTVEEISDIYEKPRSTMLSKLHRLKKRIRKRLQAEDMGKNIVTEGNLQ